MTVKINRTLKLKLKTREKTDPLNTRKNAKENYFVNKRIFTISTNSPVQSLQVHRLFRVFSRDSRAFSFHFELLLVLGVSLGCDVPAIESTEPQAASSSVPEEINSADAAPPPAISPSAVTSTSQTVQTKPKPELLVTQEIASMSLDWVCRPKFHSAYGDTVAGTCFLVEVEHNLPPVVLTANSLLGPAGGLHFDLDHSAQGNRLSQLELLDCETNESLAIYPATPLITIGRKEWAGTPIIGDIAAFQFPGAKAITAGQKAGQKK